MNPNEEIQTRLTARRESVASGQQRERSVSTLRVIVFAAFIALLWAAYVMHAISGWWSALPLVLFIVLVVRHDVLVRQRKAAECALRFYETALDHIENRWSGNGNPGDRYRDAHHPYSGDLDIFGRGSLYERLSGQRSPAGDDRLAQWLQEPAEPHEIQRRQEAIEELAARLDLREDLAVLAGVRQTQFHSDRLAA